MNKYRELKERQQEEVNAFPIKAAFSKEQLQRALEELGATADECIGVGGGCFIRKTDKKAFFDMFERHTKELWDNISNDKDGTGFIYDMFYYELDNHEYCITYDVEDTLDCLGITFEDIEKNVNLAKGLNKACKDVIAWHENNG